jgi:integrase
MQSQYSPQVHNAFATLFFTGMRPGELIALAWSTVDLINGYVRIAKRKVAGEEDAPKGNKQRDIKLPPRALAAVEAQRAFTQLADGKVFHHPELHAEYHDLRPLSEVYWEATLKRLGLRRRTLYATRHTCATLALMAGVIRTRSHGSLAIAHA